MATIKDVEFSKNGGMWQGFYNGELICDGATKAMAQERARLWLSNQPLSDEEALEKAMETVGAKAEEKPEKKAEKPVAKPKKSKKKADEAKAIAASIETGDDFLQAVSDMLDGKKPVAQKKPAEKAVEKAQETVKKVQEATKKSAETSFDIGSELTISVTFVKRDHGYPILEDKKGNQLAIGFWQKLTFAEGDTVTLNGTITRDVVIGEKALPLIKNIKVVA